MGVMVSLCVCVYVQRDLVPSGRWTERRQMKGSWQKATSQSEPCALSAKGISRYFSSRVRHPARTTYRTPETHSSPRPTASSPPIPPYLLLSFYSYFPTSLLSYPLLQSCPPPSPPPRLPSSSSPLLLLLLLLLPVLSARMEFMFHA